MLRICHVTSVHNRYDVRIFLKECVSLVKAGYSVTLLCADNLPDELNQGVTILSVPRMPVGRIRRIISAGKVMKKKALLIDAEIYHLHDPELLPLALKLKKKGKKVIFDSHEDYPLNIAYKKWIPRFLRKTISRLYSVFEDYVFKSVDAVIAVTPQICDRVLKINPHSTLITNYPIIDQQNLPEGWERDYLCFAGVIAESRLHHSILKAMEKTPNIEYRLAGWGNEQYLNRLKLMPAWARTNFLGPLTYSEVKTLYKKAFAGIVIESYSPMNYGKQGSLGVTKLFEYMAAGLPIICTDFDYHKEIIEKFDCGICVNPENIEAIANAINILHAHPEISEKMGRNGYDAFLNHYNWLSQETNLLQLYRSLSS
ncbi:MAG: glycosyltransferase [Sphingobacteriia bacterium]|nr:glycosyltransferase [Sphingobacteriia bacterium]